MLLRSYTRAQVAWADLRANLRDRFTEMAGSERGGVAAEYALLVSLIAIVIVVGAFALGNAINDRLNTTANCVNAAPGTTC
jgi:Flp pilus assembly pilin Flp